MSESFDVDAYVSALEPELLRSPGGRRAVTELDPLAFALVYLPHHLANPADPSAEFSLSAFHLDLIDQAKRWVLPSDGPAAHRDAYVAPRESGKSTWIFTILPLWAAAHGHLKFIAAFSDSAAQAEGHLRTFKSELDNNALLQSDFPLLCRPALRTNGNAVADNTSDFIAASGFAFQAKGIDTKTLGMKVGSMRPDLIVLDDIEPPASSYSPLLAKQRLGTILEALLPLSITARVVLTGTVTMAGSIIHQLVSGVRTGSAEQWIRDANFRTHYYRAIVTDPDGTERSLWPEKWPLDYLLRIRGTQDYAKNYDNDPVSDSGEFWSKGDITVKDLGRTSRGVLSIDPAITTKGSSDFTGIAVVSWSPGLRRLSVDACLQVKLGGKDLRAKVLELLEAYPHVTTVLVETNQGGSLWTEVLHDLPVRLRTVHQSVNKEVRAGNLLNWYQRQYIYHRRAFHDLETQMLAFPNVMNDDLIDATGSGVEFLLGQLSRGGASKRRGPAAISGSYL